MNKSKIALSLFLSAALINILGNALSVEVLNLSTKPLLMVFLLLYFLAKTSEKKHSSQLLIISALLFSWIGDLFLMFQSENALFFTVGLGAFLISHLFYITINRKTRNDSTSKEMSKPRLARYDFFLFLICVSLVMVLSPHLGTMLFPVVTYAITITFMTITALHRYGKTTTISFWMVMIGASFFMFSDAVIALNKFVAPISEARTIIMSTYILAQYLLVEGLLNHMKR
ncbi:MAG: lysoplasmalogenase [Cyclobacteriaceae bacterium]|nr:lysoplasmalogenase [Cyclobacteriaceae bacterium]